MKIKIDFQLIMIQEPTAATGDDSVVTVISGFEKEQLRLRNYQVTLESSTAGITTTATELGLQLPSTSDWVYVSGKVRDIYINSKQKQVMLIATDRQSAFDRQLAIIPYKSEVLTQTSIWWFNQTQDIVPNHFQHSPDPAVMVCQQCTIFPIEFVVRGFLTGSTQTSLWTNYAAGSRDYCGHVLPNGWQKYQKLPQNLVTPTTKDAEHDELISAAEIIASGKMTRAEWDYCHAKALELFAFGQAQAQERGLLLVDTKYEFGRSCADERIMLCDEMHTPDSSRYWVASSYSSQMARGQAPEHIDKEFLRLWFTSRCDPYNTQVALPQVPQSLIHEVTRRYILLYEIITGNPFVFHHPEVEPISRVVQHVRPLLEFQT